MNAGIDAITIAEAARLIRARKLSPVELTRAKLERIEALEPRLRAFATLTAERALNEARAAEAEIAKGRWRGPLHGIPIGLKDIFNTAGLLTTAGSRILADHVPAGDSTVTARLAQAGAVLAGKLATHEFAHGGPNFDLPWPPTRNPWDLTRFTGGSSSGSAAAVAAGMVLGAMGSDTGGSVRIPAALCGLAGFKPTYGLISRAGVVPNSYPFDPCGPLAWTVEDCALMTDAVAGFDAADPTSEDRPPPDFAARLEGGIRGLRVGVLRHVWEEELEATAEVRAAMEDALAVLAGLGARIEDARMRPFRDYYDVKLVVAESELYASHERELRTRARDFGADFLARAFPAILFRAADYVQGHRLRRQMLAEMEALYARFDVLVTVGALAPAPRLADYRIGASWEKPNVTTTFNVTAGPALVLCMGFDGTGLPLSLQIAGRPFDDATVLRLGHAYERATAWRARRPAPATGAAPAPISPSPPPRMPAVEPGLRAIIEARLARAGIKPDEGQLARLYAAAPYALAMAERLRGPRPWDDAAAFAFRPG